jgi:hypothetical protein
MTKKMISVVDVLMVCIIMCKVYRVEVYCAEENVQHKKQKSKFLACFFRSNVLTTAELCGLF